jgi:hypothetical protein
MAVAGRMVGVSDWRLEDCEFVRLVTVEGRGKWDGGWEKGEEMKRWEDAHWIDGARVGIGRFGGRSFIQVEILATIKRVEGL